MGQTTSQLTIPSNGIKYETKQHIQPLINTIELQPHLQHLQISGNSIGVEPSLLLFNCISSLHSLTSLDLSDIFTTRLKEEIPISLSYLTSALLKLKVLSHLNLSDNAFGLHGSKPLVEFLSKTRSLTSLVLNNNGLGELGGTLLIDALIDNVNLEGKITRLEMCRNRLETLKVMTRMSKLIELNKTKLHIIKLSQNGIRNECMYKLLEGIGQCYQLEVLDLQDNTLNAESVEFLKLNKMPKLKVLNLGECLLKNKAFIKLIKSVDENNALETLDFSYNELTERSFKEYNLVIPKLSKLLSVNVNGNNVREDSVVVVEMKNELCKLKNKVDVVSMCDMELDSDYCSSSISDNNQLDELTNDLSKLSTK